LSRSLESQSKKGDRQAVAAMQEIRLFLERQPVEEAPMPNLAPPGSPIG